MTKEIIENVNRVFLSRPGDGLNLLHVWPKRSGLTIGNRHELATLALLMPVSSGTCVEETHLFAPMEKIDFHIDITASLPSFCVIKDRGIV